MGMDVESFGRFHNRNILSQTPALIKTFFLIPGAVPVKKGERR